MLNVVLFQPEIPPNTGNVIRLCANTGARLHLIGPLGFHLDEASVRRAGLDYRDLADVRRYDSWQSYLEQNGGTRTWAFSTRGRRFHTEARFAPGDALLFGPESSGLPQAVLDRLGERRVLRLPMKQGNRSVNLSNAVAAGVYEALRQMDFKGLS